MADTIITNTPDTRDNSMGAVLLLIIIAVLVVGGILLYRSGTFTAVPDASNPETTEINVSLPTPVTEPVE